MLSIKINRKENQSLYAQLRDALLEEIAQGKLKPGDRLPAVTKFAKQLGVTPSTILRAFNDLIKQGHLVSHVGRGTFVNQPKMDNAEDKPSAKPVVSLIKSNKEFSQAAQRLRMGISKSLSELQILTQRPGLIHFTSGIPDPKIADCDILKNLTDTALKNGQDIYQGNGRPFGLPELRKTIAKRFCQEGVNIGEENVLITNGSQQAIAILAMSALESNRRALCETPCYSGIPNAFGALGQWVESVPRDTWGPLPESLMRFSDNRPSILYLCPEMHNPMGTDISDERRTMIINWVKEREVLLIADEIFHGLRFDQLKPSSFLSDVGIEQTVVVGSISKSFMGGLRVGWLVSSAERVKSLVNLKTAMDIGTPPLMQGIALALLNSPQYDAHLIKARKHYQERRDIVLAGFEQHMPPCITWTCPKGGFNMWVDLPPGYSSIALFLLAIERGVVITPGPNMDIDHRYINGFSLRYGSVEPDKIREGVELLCDAVKQLLKTPPNNSGAGFWGDFL